MIGIHVIAPPQPSIVDQVVDALAHINDPERMRGTAAYWQQQHRDLTSKATSLDVLGGQLDTREAAIVEKETALTAREAAVVAKETDARNTHDAAVALLTTAEKASKAADDKAARVAETTAALVETQKKLAGLTAVQF